MTIIKQTKDEKGRYHSFNDEPAVVYSDGDKVWYCHGKIHRDNSPAIEYSNGNKSFAIHGTKYTFHNWLKLSSLSEEEKMELLLSHAYN